MPDVCKVDSRMLLMDYAAFDVSGGVSTELVPAPRRSLGMVFEVLALFLFGKTVAKGTGSPF